MEPSCASSRQISSLLHGSWSQAVSVSKIMCDPKQPFIVFCDLGATQPLFLWLFGATTTSIVYGWFGAKATTICYG